MSGTPRIRDYALLSDCHSAALVSMDGSVEWLCLPCFDTASVFAAILDRRRGGHFSLRPARTKNVRRRYLPDTNVLETRFEAEDGVLLVTDFLALSPDRDPESPEDVVADHRLVRRAHCIEGRVLLEMECAPRPGYGLHVPSIRNVGNPRHVRFESREGVVTLDASRPFGGHDAGGGDEGDDDGGTLRARWPLARGERIDLVLGERSGDGPERWNSAEHADALEDATVGYWRDWASRCIHEGPWRDAVVRSALALKAMVYEPTGAIIAAPTTSLPEKIGGIRNWDYRYCWLRDATFTLSALQHLGYTREAVRYYDWLHATSADHPDDLRVLYGIHEAEVPAERELPHLEGYRGSRPVRVGNAAAKQFQLDVYGEVVDGYYLFRDVLQHDRDKDMRWLERVIARVAADWNRPDEGIWEVRGAPRHFVYSKALAWAALTRGARLAEWYGRGDPAGWRRLAERIEDEIVRRGFDPVRNTFVQAFGSGDLDAAVLRLPLIGFIDARDPRMLGTIEAIRRELTRDGLVYRYTTADDGLPAGEGTFALCTFWLVQCLALSGRREEARDLFERMLGFGNDLGLFAEQIDPHSGAFLGNFPQAFTHIGLINAAEQLMGREVAIESPRHEHAEQPPPAGG